MKFKQFYHGWLIELIPKSGGYSFQCWTTDEKTGLSDRQIYPTFVQALTIAKRRADLETVILALIPFLKQVHKSYHLSFQEYTALEMSIFDFVKQASRTDMRDFSTLDKAGQILCFYKNTTSQIQIIRLSNVVNPSLEQIVFPGEQVLFEVDLEAELEVITDNTVGEIQLHKIPCSQLQVHGTI
jgi:hypothetical protein